MLKRISITNKMLFLTLLLGVAVWSMIDWFQEKHLREVYLSELMDEASHQAREDRALFDMQVQKVQLSVRLMANRLRLPDYVSNPSWRQGRGCQLKYHFSPTPWMIETSALRQLFNGRYLLLISPAGEVCEIYFHYGEYDKGSLPEELLDPDCWLQKMSYNQSYLTSIDSQPYVLSAHDVVSDDGVHLATLMAVATIDDDFLINAKGIHKRNNTTMVLMDGRKGRVIASSHPESIADGAAISALKSDYLAVGKSFFDYGSSDLTVNLVSFIPLESMEKRVDSITAESRLQRFYLAALLIASFSVLTYWMAIRIKRLNRDVMRFTRKVSGERTASTVQSDELGELEARFHYLADAVVSAHARIRDEAEERVKLTQQATEGIQKANELELMRSVTDTLAVGIAVAGERRMVPFNNRMRQFMEQCSDIAQPMPRDQSIMERTLQDKGGARRTFVIMRHKVLGEDGFLIQEITVHKEAEEAMARAKEAAEAANRAKSSFLANMSHELRTPLHAILSYSNMGIKKAGTASAEKVRDYFSCVSQSGKRLLSLLDDLLDIAKLEADRMEFHFYEHDLMEVISVARMEFDGLLKERQIELVVTNRCDDSTADIDHNRMLQVVRNLLSNAIKFTPPGKTISITVRESLLDTDREKASPALSIAIADEGIGIPEQELELIFEKFVQSSATKTGAGGTGLGLSICKEIVEAHNGRIWAENSPVGGAVITVAIPRRATTSRVWASAS